MIVTVTLNAALDRTLTPRSSYGFSKLSGEYYCHAAHDEFGLPFSIVRPFNAYGPGGTGAGAGAGAGADALAAGQTLVAMYHWTFLFGPGFMACVNALLLGSLLYQSRLVPRIIPLVGLIGAPILFASDTAIMFGLWEQFSLPAGIATLPVALWEFSLGVWLVVKGFRPSSFRPWKA